MPPPELGKPLDESEVELLVKWIDEGAHYARHWAYVNPREHAIIPTANKEWGRGVIDHFVLRRLEEEGLSPSPEADRHALIRRVSFDLTGLPPTPEEVERFVSDNSESAYGDLVDRLLEKEAFGEHWARLWLDVARYADSSGYADDPPRTIWGYRDWVIRAFNENKPFDEFTVEQLAGDLLPDPTQDQLVATAFHRNTQTNNEGGTNDEEYRNVAIVDRVNTTMAAWMGTTMACAQCHTHKYDPITQKEYFEVFAIFNNSEDADRRDEAPVVQVATPEFLAIKKAKAARIARLQEDLEVPTPALSVALEKWESGLKENKVEWRTLQFTDAKAVSGATFERLDDGSLLVSGTEEETDVYSLSTKAGMDAITAIRIETIPHKSLGAGNGPGRNDNFVLNEFEVTEKSVKPREINGQFVRIDLPGKGKMIHLGEVQVFSDGVNVAPKGKASQSSTYLDAVAARAIDGNTSGEYETDSVSHTAVNMDDPWWEVDLQTPGPVDRMVIWNRTDGTLQSRLDGFKLTVLDGERNPVWTQHYDKAPVREQTVSFDGARPVVLQNATASFSQSKFDVTAAIDGNPDSQSGWAIGNHTGRRQTAVFETASSTAISADSTLEFSLKQIYGKHAIGRFRISVTGSAQPVRELPSEITTILAKAKRERSQPEAKTLFSYFATFEPSLAAKREHLAVLEKELASMKAPTTVPILRELKGDKRRKTRIQLRGNYLATGDDVEPGLPGNLHALPDGPLDRLALAQWLVDPENPLTARVAVNRFWEAIFGIGLVRTSEDFGSQGEAPSHPMLLDILAIELVQSGWDVKKFLKKLVTSSAYRQSSKVTPELFERDPENRLLARGPRFRLSAEMVRDQALFAGGLLSEKMYGAPVKPEQPSSGLSAAFGSKIDWKTSEGEDKYRRGMYTMWRRSNPYPSMAAFDAPNREVCIVRRDRTNTPLQALVTLNDPVFMEAAQGLARRIVGLGKPANEAIDQAYMICLSRPPSQKEQAAILSLLERIQKRLASDPERAVQLATDPLGDVPKGMDVTELAAWSVVSNVLLNLDEVFLKR
jgi:hypothetical protein